jgi:hypothetical protein
LVDNQEVPHGSWLAGFTSGEGSFLIRVSKSSDKVINRAQLVFTISQHVRDENLLRCILNYLNCGRYRIYSSRNLGDYICTNFEDIYTKVIPFFKVHPILGVKSQDLSDWIEVAELIQKKSHLTQGGLERILKIKSTMNRNRVYS